jgi:hypothetical protein
MGSILIRNRLQKEVADVGFMREHGGEGLSTQCKKGQVKG